MAGAYDLYISSYPKGPGLSQAQKMWCYNRKRILSTDYSASSGKPATDVSMERIPATAAVDPTNIQFTSDIAMVVPMAATAVCAIVFTALTPAAFAHFNK